MRISRAAVTGYQLHSSDDLSLALEILYQIEIQIHADALGSKRVFICYFFGSLKRSPELGIENSKRKN